MSNKKKKASRTTYAYNVISSPIAKAVLPDDTFRSFAVDFICNHPDANFERDFSRLCAIPRFSRLIASSHKRLQQVTENALSISGMRPTRAWQLCRLMLRANRELLLRFSVKRATVERAILLGECEIALAELDNVKCEFGESLWYARSKMLALSELRRTRELAEFCDELALPKEKSFLGYVVHCARVLIDTDNPLPVLKSLIFSATTELKQTKYEELASLLELLFAPRPLNDGTDFWLAVGRINAFPVVDQLVLVEQIVKFALAGEGAALEVCPFGDLREVADVLAKTVGTEALIRMTAEPDPMCSPQGDRLLRIYERGEYDSVVDAFYESLESLQNPLAYVNIVAKSIALMGDGTTTSRTTGIIPTLISQLVHMYRVNSSAANAEETMKSLAARFNSASWCIHIQAAVYKAFPWRYEGQNRTIVAKLALLTDSEVTPLLSHMAKCGDYVVETSPYQSGPLSARCRKIKRELLCLIQTDIFSEECLPLLEEFEHSDALLKDKVEVQTLYLIKTEGYDELLEYSARELCKVPSLYLVFPMARLVEAIECHRIASIAAIIASYFYNKFVSQQKDYVLNEAFDDYLYANGVDRPSLLLAEDDQIDELSLLFYQKICVPDVLDYLSCFTNINELFAERIRILDLLSERELIDSDQRIEEVEDIVSRVVVETATTNLNGAKLTVDEAAIQKKILPELQTLLKLYAEADDSSDDRFTIVREAESFGRLHGYLSGARNAVILRICNLVMRAFMFDEKLGLDKALSGEIRHGFFSNLMHARLEEAKLLAELDESGRYRPNKHWREINYLISPAALDRIEEILNSFGEKLNDLVSEAEEWMKIRHGVEGKLGVFEFELTKDDFDNIRAFVDGGRQAEQVCAFIFSILWKNVEEAASTIRDRLNGAFRAKVDLLFQHLEDDLVLIKRHMALVELMNAVGQARDGIKEDISTAAEWFRRAKSNLIQAGTLEKAIVIAISSFARVKGSVFAIRTELDPGLQEVPIDDGSVKPFILALVNLLDNCYRHSGLWSRTQVSIRGEIADSQSIIRIENDLSPEKAESMTVDFIAAIENKISNADSLNLIRTEGGSGLVKAYNGLVGIGPATRLHVESNDEKFAAVIYYGT